MSELIYLQDALQAKIFSRDLREYVVPVRVLNKLEKKEESEKQPEFTSDMAKALFNRCFALTGSQMCFFCEFREPCDKYRSVGKPPKEE